MQLSSGKSLKFLEFFPSYFKALETPGKPLILEIPEN